MTFSSYLTYVLASYAVYYGGNIAYDIFRKPTNAETSDNEEEFKITDVYIEENYSPINAEEVYNKREVNITLPSEKAESHSLPSSSFTPTDEELGSILESHEEKKKELFNVTTHGGYSTLELKSIFSEVLEGGENPFQSITEKMI